MIIRKGTTKVNIITQMIFVNLPIVIVYHLCVYVSISPFPGTFPFSLSVQEFLIESSISPHFQQMLHFVSFPGLEIQIQIRLMREWEGLISFNWKMIFSIIMIILFFIFMMMILEKKE